MNDERKRETFHPQERNTWGIKCEICYACNYPATWKEPSDVDDAPACDLNKFLMILCDIFWPYSLVFLGLKISEV